MQPTLDGFLRPRPPPQRRRVLLLRRGVAKKRRVILLRRPPKPPPPPPPPSRSVVPLIDLFCGIGGWSEGARQANLSCVLAVDHDQKLLYTHQHNHPDAQHVNLRLGPDTEDKLVAKIAECVPASGPWHLHASPPCTKISLMRGTKSCYSEESVNEGVDMVFWYLRLVARLRPPTWSMEQVPARELNGVLRWLRFDSPSVYDYVSRVPMRDYGVPQLRERCIAGSPRLITRLRREPSIRQEAPTVAQVLEPPTDAVFVRASTGKTPNPKLTKRHADGTYTNPDVRREIRPLDRIAYSCVAGHAHAYLRADYTHIRAFTPREQATLQTFPESYRFCKHKGKSIMAIGNAVPPLFARKFMEGVASGA